MAHLWKYIINRNRHQQEARSHPAHSPRPSPHRIPNKYPSKHAPEAGARPSMPSWRLWPVKVVPVLCGQLVCAAGCGWRICFRVPGPRIKHPSARCNFLVPPADRGSDLRLFVAFLKCHILGSLHPYTARGGFCPHARVREIMACGSYAVLAYFM